MEKTTFNKIVNDLKAAGITKYLCFCRGGNYQIRHNNKDTFLIAGSDYVVNITYYTPQIGTYCSSNSQFEINMVPYDNIDYVTPIESTFKEALDLMKSINAPKEVLDFISGGGVRTDISVNSRAGQYGDPLKNDFSKKDMPDHQSAYVVNGSRPVMKDPVTRP